MGKILDTVMGFAKTFGLCHENLKMTGLKDWSCPVLIIPMYL
jgi:hypothetical protein